MCSMQKPRQNSHDHYGEERNIDRIGHTAGLGLLVRHAERDQATHRATGRRKNPLPRNILPQLENDRTDLTRVLLRLYPFPQDRRTG